MRPRSESNIKNSTCDLTIGEFFITGGSDGKIPTGLDEVWIEPSCMVAVWTTERVVLPPNVTGLATLVTTLTHDGLLCLSVGVIDPGYDGHLSAFLLNFSRRSRKISLNDRLFRVLFFEHEELSRCDPWTNPKDEYNKMLSNKSRNEFANTFLDVAGITELAEKSAIQDSPRSTYRKLASAC